MASPNKVSFKAAKAKITTLIALTLPTKGMAATTKLPPTISLAVLGKLLCDKIGAVTIKENIRQITKLTNCTSATDVTSPRSSGRYIP